MSKSFSCISAACLFVLGMVFAAPRAWTVEEDIRFDHRLLGEKALTLSLGTSLPLFYLSMAGAAAPANLSFGGALGLDVEYYLNNNLRMGGSIRGSMAFSPNNRALIMVPLFFKTTYEFKSFPFSFPVSLGAGFSFTSFQSSLNIIPTLIPGAGFVWNMDGIWGFGINAQYWIAPELYLNGPFPFSESRIGNFLELTLAATYHF